MSQSDLSIISNDVAEVLNFAPAGPGRFQPGHSSAPATSLRDHPVGKLSQPVRSPQDAQGDVEPDQAHDFGPYKPMMQPTRQERR